MQEDKKKEKSGEHIVTDEELVDSAVAGNRAAFEDIIYRYEKRIYNLALKYTGNVEDASDLLQDTFLQVLKKLQTFRGDAKFSTWIFRITTNLFLMKKRKEKNIDIVPMDKPVLTRKGDSVEMQLFDEKAVQPLDLVEYNEENEILMKAIESLPDDYKTAIVLKDMNGFSNEEVAGILEITVQAVKSRVHRARLALKESLSKYYYDTENI